MDIRQAAKPDLPGILELVNAVFCRANQKPETMGSQFPFLFSEDNAGHLWVASDHGRIVSHVGAYTTEAVIEGIPVTVSSIGSVATAPEYRGRGLSTQLLQMAWNQLREERADIVLVSGARGLYLYNGCYKVGTTHSYVLKTIESKPVSKYTLRKMDELTEEHCRTFIDIEKGENTRFLRSADEFRQLYEAAGYCRIFPWRQEAFFIEQNHKVLAYFIAGFEKLEGGMEKAHIIEFHGDRDAVAKGILQLFDSSNGLNEIVLPVLGHDRLCVYLETLGFEKTQTLTYPGTIKLLNPHVFWAKFKSLLLETDQTTVFQDGDGDEEYQLLVDGQVHLEGSVEQFAQWIFSRLPLPWPNGLNYI
ncbi:MAG: GNAT family N-acetyltransferase [Tuberibacillus sp.]